MITLFIPYIFSSESLSRTFIAIFFQYNQFLANILNNIRLKEEESRFVMTYAYITSEKISDIISLEQ